MIITFGHVIVGSEYLLINREVVAADVEDFEYTPKPEYEGPFTVFNELDEVGVFMTSLTCTVCHVTSSVQLSLLTKFIDHIMTVKPNIIVTYNGDNFDWSVHARKFNTHFLIPFYYLISIFCFFL